MIAAKAVALQIAESELFAERQRRTVEGAQAVAEQLLNAGASTAVGEAMTATRTCSPAAPTCTWRSWTCARCSPELSGRQAEDRLHEIGITVNRNAVPFDPRPPMEASGLRIGTPALATRGLQREDFAEVGQIIAAALLATDFAARAPGLAERVQAIVERYPLYESRVAALSGYYAARPRTTPAPAMLCASRWRIRPHSTRSTPSWWPRP